MLVIAVAFAMITAVLSAICGPRRPTRAKLSPYECGIIPVGDARIQFSVKFYLVAMFFIIFDIEIAFLVPWAVVLRELGLFGLVEMLIFIGILCLGLCYIWMKGGLEWER